jgi:hypothetical protein
MLEPPQAISFENSCRGNFGTGGDAAHRRSVDSRVHVHMEFTDAGGYPGRVGHPAVPPTPHLSRSTR